MAPGKQSERAASQLTIWNSNFFEPSTYGNIFCNMEQRCKILCISYFTEKTKVMSTFFIISTFSVPSRSPRNITAFNTSSTSINVTWQPIPNDHVNGILLGYRVLYKRKNSLMDAFQNVTVNSTHLDAEITSLEFYTEYELRIVGFTKVGDGNVSEPVFCFTDESGNNVSVPSLRSLRKQPTFQDVNNGFSAK